MLCTRTVPESSNGRGVWGGVRPMSSWIGPLGPQAETTPGAVLGHQARKRQRIRPGGSGPHRWHQSMPSSAPSRGVDAHRRLAVLSTDRQPRTPRPCVVAATGSSGRRVVE